MRKKYYRVFFLASTLFCVVAAQAQRKQTVFKKKLIDEKGNTTMVVFDDSSSYSVEDARALLLKSKTGRGVNNNSILSRVNTKTDELGFTHEKQQQFYKGIKVEFATYSFHLKKGAVKSMNGEFYDINIDEVTPTLTSQQALEKAKKHIGAKRYMWEEVGANNTAPEHKKPEGELVILAAELINKDEARLAYKFDIYASEPLSRGNLYVDAKTGESLFYDATIKHLGEHAHTAKRLKSSADKVSEPEFINFAPLASGNAATRYSGTRKIETSRERGRYVLKDQTRSNGIETYNMRTGNDYNRAVDFTDDDNNWTAAEFDNRAKDNAALDAHWGAMMTYDYFKKLHNRDSYDDDGAAIKSYVHVNENYPNAYWNGYAMSYGDGDSNGQEGNGRFDALTSLDVAAHEIGHAVCSNTANLAYRKESGAMNEGLSDIWGASVEHFAKGNGDDMNPGEEIWLLGDEIDKRRGSKSFRSLIRPNDGNQPDTYGGRFWREVDDCYPNRNNDNCGVHTNSGVLNFWFYLVVKGGSGTNDNGDNYNIGQGIGMTKGAKITYRLETNYLSSNSKFVNAREGSIQAAEELYGKGSREVKVVTNAWYAVGVGDKYSGGDGDGDGDGDGGSNSYCSSKGDSSDEYIKRVKLGSINKTSGADNYSDFTSESTKLSNGQSYTIEITPGWSSGSYEEGYSVWIDYNQDGDFTDSGEKVFSKSPTSSKSISGQIRVPSSAKSGKTRMRVSMKYSGVPKACEKIQYGEVEDYSIVIGGGDDSSDTQAPTAPTGIRATDITGTTATLRWTASRDNVGVVAYDIYYGSKKVGTVEEPSVALSKLKPATSYTLAILARDAAGNESAKTQVTFRTSGGTSRSYCVSKGTSSDDEWIDYVAFGGMVNASGNDGGYKDNTAKVATVSRGGVSELLISAGFQGKSYNEYWGVWIDYNQDGVFDNSERVADGRSSTADKLSVKVNIPSNAVLGQTRMRVSMKFKVSQKACETFEYGEVEDYSVNITNNSFMEMLTAKPSLELTAGTKQLGDEELLDFMVYPNPASNFIAVQLGSRGEATYRIVNVIGQSVKAGQLTSDNIDISKLKAGVYIVEVNDGQKLHKTKILKK